MAMPVIANDGWGHTVLDSVTLYDYEEVGHRIQTHSRREEHKMRRSDREITDIQEILAVMKRCDVCRLALHDVEYPYILPVNFGMQIEDGQVILYFHGAREGRKYDLIARDNRASFEMDCSHKLVLDPHKGNCTMEYESVIGHGRIEVVPEAEKEDALCLLMQHYHAEDFQYDRAAIPRTEVLRLVVEQVTGKARRKSGN